MKLRGIFLLLLLVVFLFMQELLFAQRPSSTIQSDNLLGNNLLPQILGNSSGNNFYIDSIAGNDANNGLSPTLAWQSLKNVNATTFNPGDSILFMCGCSWSGVMLHPLGSGTLGNPIVVSKYGTGNLPQINGNTAKLANQQAVYLSNQEYFTISNLDITNNFQATSTKTAVKIGVYVTAKDYGVVHSITLKDLVVHDVLGTYYSNVNSGGIFCDITGSSKTTTFDSLLIDHCKVYNVDRTGISNQSSWAGSRTLTNNSGWAPSTNLIVQNCEVDSSGSNSIIIRVAQAPKIQYNKILKSSIRYSGNAVFVFNCDDALIQYNECSYNVFNSGDVDASAFDGDYRCHRTVIQYNYSHDNDGGAWVIVSNPGFSGTFDDSCVIRYNISQNDCHANASSNQAICRIDGNITNTQVYNNTIFTSTDFIAAINHCAWGGGKTGTLPVNTTYANNIFYLNQSNPAFTFNTSKNNTVSNNLFYFPPPYSGTIAIDTDAVSTDPLFINPGSGGDGYNTVDGYKLKANSPCIKAGMLLPNHSSIDFWGNKVPELAGVAPCIGAFEYPTILSVSFTDFKGESNGDINLLSWKTTEEINNAGFWVEESKDGVLFNTLSFVPTKTATGNYSGLINYSFTPYTTSTKTYYRLKQVDNNGSFHYSAIISVINYLAANPAVSVYPNPFIIGKELTLSTNNIPQGNYQLRIMDMQGKSAYREDISITSTNQTIKTLFHEKLTKAVYIIQLTNSNNTYSTRLSMP